MTDKERLVELLHDYDGENITFCTECRTGRYPNLLQQRIASLADHLIANDVVVQKRGRWTLHDSGNGTCSECHRTTVAAWDHDSVLKFCPSCGAKMDLKEGE